MADEQLAQTVWQRVADAAQSRRDAWCSGEYSGRSLGLLEDLAGDPEHLDFTRRLIDVLFGSEDAFAAAMGLRDVSQGEIPEAMPAKDRLLLRASGIASLGLPWAVRPAARHRLLSRLPQVIRTVKMSGRFAGLTEALRETNEAGQGTLVALLGNTVHGESGGTAEVERLVTLAKQPAVKQLAFDPARVVPGATDWSIEVDLVTAACRLQPLMSAALEHGVKIIVEPRDTVWARNGLSLIKRMVANLEFDRVAVGLSLMAELPESWESYAALHRFAECRVADGGAAPEVIIGLTSVAARERASSIRSGLAVPVIEDRQSRTAQLLRLAELALQPRRAAVLRPVIASEEPEVLAAVIEAARELGSEKLYGLQLRSGVASGLVERLCAERDVAGAATPVPSLRVRLPITPKGEYDEAVDLFIALIAEALDPAVLDFDGAVALTALPAPDGHRLQQRAREWDPSERDSALFYRAPDEPSAQDTGGLTAAVLGLTRNETGEVLMEEVEAVRSIPVQSMSGFANEPPTDGSLAANREWARALLRAAGEAAGDDDRFSATVALSPADLDPAAAVTAAWELASNWTEQSHDIRAVRLRRAALATAAARDRIITALAAETGAPFVALDAAVNRIIDAARYAGQLAQGLRAVRGATFVPERLVLVAADASAPLAAQATEVLGVLGSGAAVLWAVPPETFASATACLEEWEAGGLTAGAVRIVSIADDHTFGVLGASRHVDRAVVLGARSLGRDLAKKRPDLRVEGHFGARDSILVTTSAERGRAITDIVDSAFRGTQTSIASSHSVILLGSVARSPKFRAALRDAVLALRVGDSARPGTEDPLTFDIGPLSVPPSQRAIDALTKLESGEQWLVQPRQLDHAGLLWSPGVKLGVAPNSRFWEDARGLPVIGCATSALLSDAVQQQNASGSGSKAALHSWDDTEVLEWLERVEAATLYVNRSTRDAQIERQPDGGWNDAVMGLAALSGGPHWLVGKGSWRRRPGSRSETLHLRGLAPEIVGLIESAQPVLGYEAFDELRRAALADQLVWQTDLGVVEDRIGLGVERNVMRTAAVPVHVRFAEGASVAEFLRVISAALLTRAPISVSIGGVLPPEIADALAAYDVEVSLERDEAWLERIAVEGPRGPGGMPASRVRLIGGDRVRVAEWMGGLDRAALWAEPVTMAGSVELLVFLREQAISARAERHGLADRAVGVDALLE